MPTKQSYYRDLPEEKRESKKVKALDSYPKDVQNIVDEIIRIKFRKMTKKHSKVLGVIFKLLVHGEKKLKK